MVTVARRYLKTMEHARRATEMYSTGMTLQEIGVELGFTREYVRLLIGYVTGSTNVVANKTARAAKRLKREVEWLKEHESQIQQDYLSMSVADLQAKYHVSPRLIKLALAPMDELERYKASVGRRGDSFRIYSDEELDSVLLEAAQGTGKLSKKDYKEWRDRTGRGASYLIYTWRFGSWVEAVARVGLDPGRANRNFRKDRVPDAELLDRVIACYNSHGRIPTYQEFEDWSNSHPGPKAITARVRFGHKWVDAIEAALERVKYLENQTDN